MRIEGIPEEKASLFVRFAYWFTRRKFGKLLQPVRVTAHHPRLLQGIGAYELALERSTRVPAALKELAAVRAALLVGCPF
jgi:alkylhydroperoxidase family enzyme